MSTPKRLTTTRPSMADVGRLANVSPQTVSRYFTGVGYVRDETRERITAAIVELGYRRTRSAQHFRTQRMNTVGVLSMGTLTYGSAEILTGLCLAAREAGMSLTISQIDVLSEASDWQSEARAGLEHLLSIPADGVIVVTPLSGVDSLLKEAVGATPLVTVSDRPSSLQAVASIHSHAAALTATRYLLELGHTRIVHIAGPGGRNEAHERIRGYTDAMAEAGIRPNVVDVADDWSPASGFRAAQALDHEDFTAVMTANDEIALGFMSAMERQGLRAPVDYSIVGIDDMPAAAFFSPPLTTMWLDFRTLGAQAFRLLHQELSTGEPAGYWATEPELIVRASTAPHDQQP